LIDRGAARAIALLTAGSIAVHELRYVVADSPSLRQSVSELGHSSVSLAEALALALLVVAMLRFAKASRRARSGAMPKATHSAFLGRWLATGGSLAALFVVQEAFEGALVPGRPGTIGSVFTHRGWTALIFCAVIGGLIALLTRIADAAIQIVAERVRPRTARSAPSVPRRPLAPAGWRLHVLACHLAGRAPPTWIQPQPKSTI
jgi:hypothetical protein